MDGHLFATQEEPSEETSECLFFRDPVWSPRGSSQDIENP